METTPLTRYLIIAHGLYLTIGGLWPLFYLQGFEAVTGPKVEDFLVRTIALILLLTAVVLFLQLRKPKAEQSAIAMAAGVSFILGLVGIITAAGGWIRPIYFADGAIHLLFAMSWAALTIHSVVADRQDLVPPVRPRERS